MHDESDGAVVAIDRELVLRAIANLLDIAHSHGAPPIEVTTTAQGVAVRDAGAGLTDTELAACIRPFTSTREAGGGFGLAFVAHVARTHGGALRVGDGPGTCVVLELSGSKTTPS